MLRIKFFAMLLVCLLLFAASASAEIVSELALTGRGYVTKTELAVYTAPGGERLGMLEFTTEVAVKGYAHPDEWGWFRISTDRGDAYLPAEHVITGFGTKLYATMANEGTAYYAKDLNAEPAMTFTQGQQINLSGRTGKWWALQMPDGREAYIHMDDIASLTIPGYTRAG